MGLGGHSLAILEASSPNGTLYAVDWNEESLKKAKERLKEFEGRTRFFNANFVEALKEFEEEGVLFDGVLLDLGLSSFLIERSGRGFSFLRDEPLDMRMGEDLKTTAKDLVNQLSFKQLVELIRTYGEEPQAVRIARAIVEARKKKRIETSGELAEVISKAVKRRRRGLHPATLTFQALRIAVNRELENLKEFLARIPSLLKPGGRIAVISFHSLEDRIVKTSFKSDPRLKVVTKRPVVASCEEVRRNPRARSAKLRVAERC